jgi:hypothetical protein
MREVKILRHAARSRRFGAAWIGLYQHMAGVFASTRVFVVVGALTFSCAYAAAAPAQVTFDIPAQPLRQALEQYDTATGISVLYASDLAQGRSSSAVRGRYAPDVALRLMIEGTGLAAQAVNDRAFVLRAAVTAVPNVAPQAFRPSAYDALLQRRVYEALCVNADSAMGNYRIALALHIDTLGRIGEARLLDTTGDPRRDASIVETLQGVMVGSPPADTVRPFVILIVPHPGAAGLPCTQAP